MIAMEHSFLNFFLKCNGERLPTSPDATFVEQLAVLIAALPSGAQPIELPLLALDCTECKNYDVRGVPVRVIRYWTGDYVEPRRRIMYRADVAYSMVEG